MFNNQFTVSVDATVRQYSRGAWIIRDRYGVVNRQVRNLRPEDNNLAELLIALLALQHLVESGMTQHPVHLKTDNASVAEQLTAGAVPTSKRRPLVSKARQLMAKFPAVNVEWVPRQLNDDAHRLAAQTANLPKIHKQIITP